MILKHPRRIGATRMFGSWLHASMPAAFARGLAAIAVFPFSGTLPRSVAIEALVSAPQSCPLLAAPLLILRAT